QYPVPNLDTRRLYVVPPHANRSPFPCVRAATLCHGDLDIPEQKNKESGGGDETVRRRGKVHITANGPATALQGTVFSIEENQTWCARHAMCTSDSAHKGNFGVSGVRLDCRRDVCLHSGGLTWWWCGRAARQVEEHGGCR